MDLFHHDQTQPAANHDAEAPATEETVELQPTAAADDEQPASTPPVEPDPEPDGSIVAQQTEAMASLDFASDPGAGRFHPPYATPALANMSEAKALSEPDA